jgi:hypothetical protein
MRFPATCGVAFLYFGFASASASPQVSQATKPAPLVTDRPKESTSTNIVPRLTFQTETGYTFKRRDNAGTRIDIQVLPETLFRFGITKRLESRVMVTGWNLDSVRTAERQLLLEGFNDVSVGATFFLAEGKGWRPALGVLGEVSWPLGDPGFTDNYVNPKLLALMDFVLTDRIGFTVNVGPNILRVKDERHGDKTVTDLKYAATFAGAVTDRLGLFIDVFGAVALSQDRKSRFSYQGGMTYLLTALFQVDVRAGVGLVGNVPDWLVGTGFSFRIPR